MSILINGMAMPQSCRECRFMDTVYRLDGRRYICIAHLNEIPDPKERLDTCPLEDDPVVRCKDCKYNYSKKHNKRYNSEDIVCDYFETDGLNDDDFCSYGERSEE